MEPFDIEEAIEQVHMHGFRQWLTDMMVDSFEEARKNKIKTHDEHTFDLNWMENLENLVNSILDESYKPSPSVTFVIHEPMVREIFAAPFRDRVVHHFLYKMQAGWWDRRFIPDSYSCREGKGTLYGVERVQKMMRAAQSTGEKVHVIKLDIRGYFMSLSRKKLFKQVKWGLDRQFRKYMDDPAGYRIYKTCVFLWKQVIFDDPVKKAWRRGPKEDWDPENLPPEKSLYQQPDGYGIVIGNLTSQLVSNIYLNLLDRYIKHTLGYIWYGRYVDDFIIIVTESQYEQAKKDIEKIEKFLKDELELTLHPKKRRIQPVEKGVEFLGARIFPNFLYPSDRLQKKFNQMLSDMDRGKKDVTSFVSYLGILKHYDALPFIERTMAENGWWHYQRWLSNLGIYQNAGLSMKEIHSKIAEGIGEMQAKAETGNNEP